MKTMNANEMRKINGGGHYICTTGKCKTSGAYVSTTKWTMGYHFLFCHTKEADAGRCTSKWVRW